MPERPPARQPLRLTIPGRRDLILTHVVLDFNGSLALDGKLIAGVATRLRELSRRFVVTVLTADTHRTARQALRDIPLKPIIAGTAQR